MSSFVTITHVARTEIFVYSVKCGCGANLDFEATLDTDQDLLIQVAPHVCEQKLQAEADESMPRASTHKRRILNHDD